MIALLRAYLADRFSERTRGLIYRLLFAAGVVAVAFGFITEAETDTILALVAEVLGTGLASANTSIAKEE